MIAPTGVTAPQDGVIATRPATAPDAMPSVVALPCRIRSMISQPITAAAVATWVFTKVTAAVVPALSAEPALKPNQPNHSRPAPRMTSGRLCGRIGSFFQPIRLPSTIASARRGGTGVHVHRRTTGEVDRLQLVADPAALAVLQEPDRVRDREVHQERPAHDERDPATEGGPVRDRTRDQRRRDDREHQLERDERERRRRAAHRVRGHQALQADFGEVTDHMPGVAGERQRVADHHPHDRDDGDGDETHHHHVQHALHAHHAAVEEGQAWCHQHHQGGACQDPGGIAGVDLHQRHPFHRSGGGRRPQSGDSTTPGSPRSATPQTVSARRFSRSVRLFQACDKAPSQVTSR